MAEDDVVDLTSGAASGRKAAANDAGLIAQLRAGDEDAFTQLVRRHHASLIRLAMVFVANREVAEEVVQETWLGVLSGLSAFEGRSALKSWIFSILTNRAKTRAVREKRSVPFSAVFNTADDEPSVDPDRFTSSGGWAEPPTRWDKNTPEQLMLRREARATIDEAMAHLPPNQRAVVTLRDVEGLDAVEVCNMLGISETNQRVLLHRGRSKFRAVLERYLRPAAQGSRTGQPGGPRVEQV